MTNLSFIDSNIVRFFGNNMDMLSQDLNNINLDDVNSDKKDPETIIHVTIMTWCNKSKKRKAFKNEISKELMFVAWHPTRWWK